jgi:hypothetical protein
LPDSRRSPSGLGDTIACAASPIGIAFLVISVGVLALTFPGRYSDIILAPALVPVFGVPFAIGFAALQFVVTLSMPSIKGTALVACVMVVAGALVWVRKFGIFWPLELSPEIGFTFARAVICGAACAGGAALGIALVTGWLSRP